MKRARADHVKIDTLRSVLVCERCRTEEPLKLPISVRLLTKLADAFIAGHKDCELMKAAPKPCGSCPYRRDVPSGVWHPSEYAKLKKFDGDTSEQSPRLFMCHSNPSTLCAGWLGCHGPEELLAVRLGVLSGKVDPSVRDFTTDVPLFSSGAEAARHGTARVSRPGKAARETIDKLTRARRRGGPR